MPIFVKTEIIKKEFITDNKSKKKFVEVDKGLWGIILLGVFFTIISIIGDYGYDENRDKH